MILQFMPCRLPQHTMSMWWTAIFLCSCISFVFVRIAVGMDVNMIAHTCSGRRHCLGSRCSDSCQLGAPPQINGIILDVTVVTTPLTLLIWLASLVVSLIPNTAVSTLPSNFVSLSASAVSLSTSNYLTYWTPPVRFFERRSKGFESTFFGIIPGAIMGKNHEIQRVARDNFCVVPPPPNSA